MIKTHVTWTLGASVTVSSKLNEMIAEGKTDGVGTTLNESNGQFTVERTWDDLNSANEWVEYITNFNPISATVVE